MSLFVTGDTHATYDFKKIKDFKEKAKELKLNLTKEDYLLILGDFGFIWNYEEPSKEEIYWLNWLHECCPWTTLFLGGNHENYDRLNDEETYPIVDWHGGKVQFINDSVIHLIHGNIYNICGSSCLILEGAQSHDIDDGILEIGDPLIKEWRYNPYKSYRINHLSWWADEIPNKEKCNFALKNLTEHDNKVDFVFSHEAPASAIALMYSSLGSTEKNEYAQWLETIHNSIDFKKWCFGHHHTDIHLDSKNFAFYNEIMEVA